MSPRHRQSIPCSILLALALGLGACSAPPKPTVDPATDATPAPRAQIPLPMGRHVTETARQYLGYDYLYGGTGDGGFDCSGLVATVFARHGLHLPRSSVQQYRWGQPVERNELREGDLVFFANSAGRIDHVGIWSGNGHFIHASSSRGVVEDPSTTRWFRNHFVGGRRVGIARADDQPDLNERRSQPVGS